MAALAYLDTHVAAWLFAGDITRLSAAARVAIEGDDLLVSAGRHTRTTVTSTRPSAWPIGLNRWSTTCGTVLAYQFATYRL